MNFSCQCWKNYLSQGISLSCVSKIYFIHHYFSTTLMDHMKKALLPMPTLLAYGNFFLFLNHLSSYHQDFSMEIFYVSFLWYKLCCHWYNSLKRSDWNKRSTFLKEFRIFQSFSKYFLCTIFKNNIQSLICYT